MKISCEIIKDLMPLYHDGICSNDSRTMVEEHIVDCDSCKAELQAIDDALPINNVDENLNEAEAVKELSKKWKQGMLKSTLKGILLTIAIILLIYCFLAFHIETTP